MGQGSKDGVSNKAGVALFDFDGTIITMDSMFLFLRHISDAKSYCVKWLKVLPILVLNRIGLVSTTKAKSKLLSTFLKGIPLTKFSELCISFITQLSDIVDPWHLKQIETHKENGDRILIVTASAEDWVKPWADLHDIEVIGTKLKKGQSTVDGSIIGSNCKGEEKVKRINSHLQLPERKLIYAYGDSKADIPMLGLAYHSYMNGKPYNA